MVCRTKCCYARFIRISILGCERGEKNPMIEHILENSKNNFLNKYTFSACLGPMLRSLVKVTSESD